MALGGHNPILCALVFGFQFDKFIDKENYLIFMPKTIIVLGAYGGTGRVLCRRLLQYTQAKVVLGGRSEEKLRQLQTALKHDFDSKRIRSVVADAADPASLERALRGVDMIIVASNTPQYVKDVATAALRAGVDYFDYHFKPDVLARLKQLQQKIESSGRLFITQGGFHPGLPAAFVRYAAPRFTTYRKALVAMAMSAELPSPESAYDLVDELQDPHVTVYKNGQWKNASFSDTESFDLGRFGKQQCFPLEMPEMRLLPQMFGLTDTGVYVAGFNWFIDYFVFPFAFILGKIKKGFGRHLIGRLMVFGFNRIPARARGVAFALEADGEYHKKLRHVRILADHEDAYDFTVLPVVACVKQYLKGALPQSGLFMMAHVVKPEQLIKDLKLMGIKFIIRET